MTGFCIISFYLNIFVVKEKNILFQNKKSFSKGIVAFWLDWTIYALWLKIGRDLGDFKRKCFFLNCKETMNPISFDGFGISVIILQAKLYQETRLGPNGTRGTPLPEIICQQKSTKHKCIQNMSFIICRFSRFWHCCWKVVHKITIYQKGFSN